MGISHGGRLLLRKYLHQFRDYLGFPGGSDSKESACNAVFLPGKSHGQRTLEGYSPWGHKESDTTE